MSWHFLQGLEEVSSEAIYWDGERFAPSSGQTTLGKYCLPDSETESCHNSQSGTMCKHLTENLGKAESMSSAADSLAKIFPVLERARESLAKDQGCGPKWRGSSVKLSQDGSWLKIHPFSLLADSEPFCGTWPKWGSMRNGECLERLTPERPTSVTESGSLPGDGRLWMTPKASDGIFATPSTTGRTRRMSTHLGTQIKFSVPENGGRPNPDWIEWLMGWPIGWTGSKPLAMAKSRLWQH